MHDIKAIRENPDAFDRGLARRGLAPKSAELLTLDDGRKVDIQGDQEIRARRNKLSKEIGQAKAANDEDQVKTLLKELSIRDSIKVGIDKVAANYEKRLNDALAVIPNIPLDEVCQGIYIVFPNIYNLWASLHKYYGPDCFLPILEK